MKQSEECTLPVFITFLNCVTDRVSFGGVGGVGIRLLLKIRNGGVGLGRLPL